MVFYNLFIFLNNSEAVNDIRWLVIKLLEDEQLEASDAFSALLSNHWFLPFWSLVGKLTCRLIQEVFPAWKMSFIGFVPSIFIPGKHLIIEYSISDFFKSSTASAFSQNDTLLAAWFQ